jgi:hypothetical protein
VKIAAPLSGEMFEAQLEEDEFHMLWVVDRHPRTGARRVWLLLSAALKNGCRIVNATPARARAARGAQVQERRVQ